MIFLIIFTFPRTHLYLIFICSLIYDSIDNFIVYSLLVIANSAGAVEYTVEYTDPPVSWYMTLNRRMVKSQ